MLGHERLKARQRAIRHTFPESLGLRVHRALSWLGRAERETEDPDARFTFLWIAFNAAYANEARELTGRRERERFRRFLRKLVELDTEGRLYRLVWDHFPGPIRLLIDNRYVFQPFWDFHNGLIAEEEWQRRFRGSRAAAHRALARQDTAQVLGVVFDRLYVLRNQILHGGATWGSSVNRQQVTDGAAILGQVVPVVIELMMDHPGELWGEPTYPVV